MSSCGAVGDHDDDDGELNTFRQSAAVGAIAAWSRQGRASTSTERQTETETASCPPSASPSASPARERTPTRITTSLAFGATSSQARDDVVYPLSLAPPPPASSTAFVDRAAATTTLDGSPSPDRTDSAERDLEPIGDDHGTLSVELRLAREQRERLGALLQRHARIPRAPSPPHPQACASSPSHESRTPSPPPRATLDTDRVTTTPTAAGEGRSSPSLQSGVLPSASLGAHEEDAADADVETTSATRHVEPSGVLAALRYPRRRSSHGERLHWRQQLDLIGQLQHTVSRPAPTECGDSAATAAYRRRGLLRTPPPLTRSPSDAHALPCPTPGFATWAATHSGNVLIGEDGAVAVAEMSRACAEIARAYGVSPSQVPRVAVVPTYAISTRGVYRGDLAFTVQLWTTVPAPLSRPPLGPPSAAPLAATKRFAVGLAGADFKGPQTGAPSFLFWSDGTAVATVDTEAAYVPYGMAFGTEDEVSAHVDMAQGRVSFAVNGCPYGVAFCFAASQDYGTLYPVVVFCEDGDAATLTSFST